MVAKTMDNENEIKKDPFSFDVNLIKRYYHFVVVSKTTEFSISDLWNILPYTLSRRSNHIINKELSGIKIQQRRIESKFAFRRSDEANPKLLPPYYYDIFVSEIDNHIIMMFPFRIFATNCITELMDRIDGLEFWRLEMNDFVQSNYENTSKQINSDFGTNILGVNVGIKGEEYINSVSIAGEHPLDSNFYKDFLKDPIESKAYTINNISIKGSVINETESYPKSRAKVHLDFFGNGKFYIHKGGKNIWIMVLVWKLLMTSKCLKATKENPIPRLKREY